MVGVGCHGRGGHLHRGPAGGGARAAGARASFQCRLWQPRAHWRPIGDIAVGIAMSDRGPSRPFSPAASSSDPIEAVPNKMLGGTKRIQAWPSGTPTDSEDTLRFAEYTGVRPMIEKFPLAKVNEAYARMTSGKAQFRVVLTM